MSTVLRSVRLHSVLEIGHRLHRPWSWHRMGADVTGEHACPACDGHGIVRAAGGWHNCPRCGFGDQA